MKTVTQKSLLKAVILLTTSLWFNQISAADTVEQIEAVAKVQETLGFQTTHSVGISFQSFENCQFEMSRLNVILKTLQVQGLFDSGRSVSFDCQKAQAIQIISNNNS